tara:strand:- start:893 stop:1726 length:834 start_codon:yes stop_codon:yes gene_type:complete
MFNREEIAQELKLRESIRKAIKIVSVKQKRRSLIEQQQEQKLRTIICELIKEGQSAVAAVAKHDNTGINSLEDLLKNSNILSVLETGYKSLTTDKQQRDSYRNHVLSAVEKSLAPEESRKAAGEDVEITEEIDIEIGDRPEDDPDFIDINDDDKVEEPEPPDEREEFGIEGEDKTGRNRAFTDFQNIEKVILTAFDDLDNPADITLFEEYLIKNLSLYFDKYENELDVTVEAPAIASAATPGIEGDEGTDEVSDMPAFELQEVIKHLNIDDIIEKLL